MRSPHFSYTAKKSAASGGAGPQSVTIEQEEMTGEHKSRLQELEMRDMKQNQTIELISKGIDRLQVTANAMGEEVTTQAGMLANLDADLEKVQEHVESVNSKLAETLKEVSVITIASRMNTSLCTDDFHHCHYR